MMMKRCPCSFGLFQIGPSMTKLTTELYLYVPFSLSDELYTSGEVIIPWVCLWMFSSSVLGLARFARFQYQLFRISNLARSYGDQCLWFRAVLEGKPTSDGLQPNSKLY